MKRILLLLTVISLLVFVGCSPMLKKTNTPEANRKSDNAIPKENSQDVVIEMEEE